MYLWLNAVSFQIIASGDRFTFVWLTHETLGTSSRVSGLVVFLLGLPMFVLVLPAGAIADRGHRRRQLYLSQLAGAVVTGACAVLVWTDTMTVGFAMLAALGFGAAFAFAQPVRSSLVPLIVPRAQMLVAIPLITIGANLAMVFGPVIAGYSIDVWNIGAAFALQSVFFLVGVGLLTRIAVPETTGASDRRLGADIVVGLRYVWTNSILRTLFLLMSVGGMLMMGPAFLLVPQIASDVYGRNATQASSLFGFMGVGMTLMSLLLMKLRHRIRRRGLAFMWCIVFGTSVSIVMGVAPTYRTMAFLLFLWGVSGGVWANMSQVLLQEATSPEMMGRVMSVTALVTTGLAPLGALASGLVADVIGAQKTMMWTGIVGLAVAVTVLRYGHRLRQVP